MLKYSLWSDSSSSSDDVSGFYRLTKVLCSFIEVLWCECIECIEVVWSCLEEGVALLVINISLFDSLSDSLETSSIYIWILIEVSNKSFPVSCI